jgi:hypothetical protein
MTIAKNFVTSGNWAANKMDFSSATSSPLWSLAISGVYFIFGVNIYTPFILNLLFGIFAIYAAYYILHKSGIKKYSFHSDDISLHFSAHRTDFYGYGAFCPNCLCTLFCLLERKTNSFRRGKAERCSLVSTHGGFVNRTAL